MRNNWGKLFVIMMTAAAIGSTVPTACTPAFAAVVTDSMDSEAVDTDMTGNIDAEASDDASMKDKDEISTEIEDDTSKDDSKDTSSEADEKNSKEASTDKNTKKETKTSKKEIVYTEKTLTITKAAFVADSFNGVDALYRKGSNDGSSTTYSCAAFIKKYYQKVYGVSVYNLFGGSTPKTYEGKKISSVKAPKEGDIAYKNNHWSIVKKVNANGTVTLIEQNWKWGGNQCKANRTVDISSLKYFRLAK